MSSNGADFQILSITINDFASQTPGIQSALNVLAFIAAAKESNLYPEVDAETIRRFLRGAQDELASINSTPLQAHAAPALVPDCALCGGEGCQQPCSLRASPTLKPLTILGVRIVVDENAEPGTAVFRDNKGREVGRIDGLATGGAMVRDYYSELLVARGAVQELEQKVFSQEQAILVLRTSVASYQRDMASPPAYLQDAVIKAAGLGAMAEQIAVLKKQATSAPSPEALEIARNALDEIALAGMSGSGQESEEGMRDWHARRAWEFIGIAARAIAAIAALSTQQAQSKGGET